MNAKKILVAVLGLATTATWGPQVWESVAGSQEPEVVYPEADEVGLGATKAAPRAVSIQPVKSASATASQAPETPPSMSSETSSGRVQKGAPAGQVQDLLGVLETFAGGRSSSLTELLEERPSWLDDRTSDLQEVATSTVQELGARVTSEAEESAMRTATVESFLAASPLTAIIHSESGAWAMIGGRIVREGDVLLPKLLRVQSISARQIELNSPEGKLELLLPPFQASARGVAPETAPAPPDLPVPAESSSLPALDPS
jgi:hypothetical protein